MWHKTNTHNKPWLIDYILDNSAKCQGRILRILKTLSGPHDDGSICKEGSDGHACIETRFSAQALAAFTQGSDDSQMKWDSAIIIIKKHQIQFIPHEKLECCKYMLWVDDFSMWSLQGNMRPKRYAEDCMENPAVRRKCLHAWNQWRKDREYTECESVNKSEVSQSTSNVGVSLLLEQMGAASQSTQKTQPSHSQDPDSSEARLILPPKLQEDFDVNDFLVSSADKNILQGIEEWMPDFVPPSSHEESSSETNHAVSNIKSVKTFSQSQASGSSNSISYDKDNSLRNADKTDTSIRELRVDLNVSTDKLLMMNSLRLSPISDIQTINKEPSCHRRTRLQMKKNRNFVGKSNTESVKFVESHDVTPSTNGKVKTKNQACGQSQSLSPGKKSQACGSSQPMDYSTKPQMISQACGSSQPTASSDRKSQGSTKESPCPTQTSEILGTIRVLNSESTVVSSSLSGSKSTQRHSGGPGEISLHKKQKAVPASMPTPINSLPSYQPTEATESNRKRKLIPTTEQLIEEVLRDLEIKYVPENRRKKMAVELDQLLVKEAMEYMKNMP